MFRELWAIIAQYVDYNEDVPWRYSERSIVGYLTAAACRAGYLAMEEFPSERDADRPKGRVDWWVATTHDHESGGEIYAECKHLCLASRADWSPLDNMQKEAEGQLRGYKLTPSCQHMHRLVMCCVAPYYMRSQGYEREKEAWLREVREPFNYCAYYWLSEERLEQSKSPNGHTHPGLLIYCQEVQ